MNSPRATDSPVGPIRFAGIAINERRAQHPLYALPFAPPMRILVCPDKFKDCLSAAAASDIIAKAILARHPRSNLICRPISDGGDGLASILTRAAGGRLVFATVAGPQGEAVQAHFGLVRAGDIPQAALQRLQLAPPLVADALVGIIEMACASGLSLLPPKRRDPWASHTAGTGTLIALAASAGAHALLIGLGGSATHDLGLGALSALGYTFYDAEGASVCPPAPRHWHRIRRIAGALAPQIPQLRVLCDVTNPLLGDNGAATTYAPQKGLRKEDITRLEAASRNIAQQLCCHHGLRLEALESLPGYGAAGGVAFGLRCAAGAQRFAVVPGFDCVADWLQLPQAIAWADVVITAEGSFDASSMQGKGPGALATRALAAGKQVHVFAGKITTQSTHPNLRLHAITPEGMPLKDALQNVADLLRASAEDAFSAAPKPGARTIP